ncbi:MAG: BREX-1 system adenine-specific DNA-methyltransferase PglX [Lachnospiraceae bacterium]|nr:BREX-1 system adenine-specific DNA-methyltransferase PglX [Lachnospiraceae bacterium]
MNKAAIKKFAIEARRKLMASVSDKAGMLGITDKDFQNEPAVKGADFEIYKTAVGTEVTLNRNQCEQRRLLVTKMEERGFESIIEEVAYTWFNRICAIRFMEVNDYLPSRVRVLSSEKEGKNEPDLVTHAPEVDLDFNGKDREYIIEAKMNNKLDDLFKMLFIKQCNKLHEVLPELFEETEDYTEMLFNVSYSNEDDIIRCLIDTIPEADFKEAVEIIGWLYQYYNEEKKNEVININKGNIEKDDLPAATQLFTTDWIVRYMVDNSLGKYWIERNPNTTLKNKLTYLVENENEYAEKIQPEQITFIDPCMGSGHILVYAFDVLMDIYRECGYNDRDSAKSILENNIYGLDIDKRAYQLAYFSIMMKARSFNRRILTCDLELKIVEIHESNTSLDYTCNGLIDNMKTNSISKYLLETFNDAKEKGSLLCVKDHDYSAYIKEISAIDFTGQLDLSSVRWLRDVKKTLIALAKQADILKRKYSVVVTNPPYLSRMSVSLKNYLAKDYADYAGDMFSAFIYRNSILCEPNGYLGYMTPFVWMFIKKYEKLRNYIIDNKTIVSLIQMEYSAFEEAIVPICTFVILNRKTNANGVYFKLSEFKGGMDVQRSKVENALKYSECNYMYYTNQEIYRKLPGEIIAFWISEQIIKAFENEKTIAEYGAPRVGLQTGENEKFVRLWHEIDFSKFEVNAKSHQESCESGAKWFPYNKGGEYRKWYGNNDYVVDWYCNGKNIKEDKLYKLSIGKCLPSNSKPKNEQFYFLPSITWSKISSGSIAFRYKPAGHIFDTAGTSIFSDLKYTYYLLGFCNSKVAMYVASTISPTINYQSGDIAQFPVIYNVDYKEEIEQIVKRNIVLTKSDWDIMETSWDFETHPLIKEMHREKISLREACKIVIHESKLRFDELKNNEERLNKIFNQIYGVENEMDALVKDSDVSIRILDETNLVKSFISYAIGCMFGRYKLENPGILYAGGPENENIFVNASFDVDKDNIIPITDVELLEDDVVNRFLMFLKISCGEQNYQDNLEFIGSLLNRKESAKSAIRNYFISTFYSYHIKIYQKRPIYWMFSSGKENAFKALVYVHRFDKDLLGKIRTEYLHKIQELIETSKRRNEYLIESTNSSLEKGRLTKEVDRQKRQLHEIMLYDQALAHMALKRVTLNTDEGIIKNYELFQSIEIHNEGMKSTKISLLERV